MAEVQISGGVTISGEVLVGARLPAPATDHGTYPEPPLPTRPANAGGKMIDPTYGTTIMRVSDANDGTTLGNVYSYWPSINCDNTRVAVFDSGNGNMFFRALDPVTYTLGAKSTPSVQSTIYWGGGEYWHPTDPDVIYGMELGTRFYSYNVATDTYTLVKDLTSLLPADRYLFQLSANDDVTIIGATIRRISDGAYLGYMAYNLNTSTMIINTEAAPDTNEVHMAKGGGWIGVDMDAPQRVVFRNLNTLATQTLLYSDDGLSHNTMQTSNVVGNTAYSTATISEWPLSNVVAGVPPTGTRVILQDADGGVGYGSGLGHVSCLMDTETWAMESTFAVTDNRPFANEIYLIATDGSQDVYRFCQHRSVYGTYYDAPRANISRDGKWIAFTSNWGDSGRLDLYIVNIPDSPAA